MEPLTFERERLRIRIIPRKTDRSGGKTLWTCGYLVVYDRRCVARGDHFVISPTLSNGVEALGGSQLSSLITHVLDHHSSLGDEVAGTLCLLSEELKEGNVGWCLRCSRQFPACALDGKGYCRECRIASGMA